MNKDERQTLCIRRWLDNKGLGIMTLCTGFGKTRVALRIIKSLSKHKDLKVLISVPTDVLQKQWIAHLTEWKLLPYCSVKIINTIIKYEYEVDLLIIDELHTVCSTENINIFNHVKYNYFLGLTGTLERLDEREKLLFKHATVIDSINLQECLENNWLSDYREYKVLLDVDLSEYNNYNREFYKYFSKFDFKFDIAMKCSTDRKYRWKWAKMMNISNAEATIISANWMRNMRKRKQFVMSHPKKIDICHKIIENRMDKKGITFSATIKDAELIKYGSVLSSKETSKKKKRMILSDFNELSSGILNSSKMIDVGLDSPGINLGIILSGTSSSIQKRQRLGRIIRYEEGKISELFTLVIKGTNEENWFNNSSQGTEYITITEDQLELVLSGEYFETRKRNDIINKELRY